MNIPSAIRALAVSVAPLGAAAAGRHPWKEGTGEYDGERVWLQARVLHFPKLNVTVWFDGSELVGS